ncbi:MAG: membrane protein insertion efficiency factor YidD [bacterium]
MSLRVSKKRKELNEYNNDKNYRNIKKNIFLNFFILLIIIYQKIISPFFGQKCRFIPTCSNYSVKVLKKYGLIKGFILSIKRIIKCHPWNKGGYDPVP